MTVPLKILLFIWIVACMFNYEGISSPTLGTSSNVVFLSFSVPSVIDTFSNKYVTWFSKSDIPLGDLKRGDTLYLEIQNIKGGKVKDLQFSIGNRLVFSQSKISKQLPVQKIYISEAGSGLLQIDNTFNLLPKRFTLIVEVISPKKKPLPLDYNKLELPENIVAINDSLMQSGIGDRKLRVIRSPNHQVIRKLEIITPSKIIPLAKVKNKRIGIFKSIDVGLGSIQKGDTLQITFKDSRRNRKFSELLLFENKVLYYGEGKIDPKGLQIIAPTSTAADYSLTLNNKGHLLPRYSSFEVQKRTANTIRTFVRDTVDYAVKEIETFRDTVIELYRTPIELKNALNFEQPNSVALKFEIPNVFEEKIVKAWHYLILPSTLLEEESRMTVLEEEDLFPSLKDNLCYTITKKEYLKTSFQSNFDNCLNFDFFKRGNFYSNTIPLKDSTETQIVHFFAKNLNKNLNLNAVVKIYIIQSLKQTAIEKIPIIQFSPIQPAIP